MKAQSHRSRMGAPDTHLYRRFLSKAPHQQRNQTFGLAMLAVGSAIALLAHTTPATASTFDFSQKFIAPDGAMNDWLGFSVAINGNYALTGSLNDDNDNGSSAGSAYLFDITSGNLLQKFIAPDGASYDQFGNSVALNENYALIGSYRDDDNGSDSGSAYLFDLTSGNLLQKFLAPDGNASDFFGWSVALDEDYALIGSYLSDENVIFSGSAYLFDLTSGDLIQKFIAPDGAIGDQFGYSVALDGDYALIGSNFDDDNGKDSGSAYLFDITSGDLLHKFIAPDGAINDFFSQSVALDGNYVLISSHHDDDNGSNSGSAYLFDLASGNLLHKFIAPDGASNDSFSWSVALDGDYALISALGDYNNGINGGSSYLFDINSGDLLQKFIAPDAASADNFGSSVALDGDSALIGSRLDDDGGINSGSAYLFAREEMEKVPEPSAILGLIAIGTLGVLKRFSGKQTQ